MERGQIRRRSFIDSLFGPPIVVDGATVRTLLFDADRFAPATPPALVSDEIDDLLLLPGQLVAIGGSATASKLDGDPRFRRAADLEGPVVRYAALDQDPARAVATVLQALAEFAPAQEVAPVHAFISHQRMHGGDDPELAAPMPEPRGSDGGAGRTITVLDTGLAAQRAWLSPLLRVEDAGDTDPCVGIIDPAFLGRAAGHGTFVGGAAHQVAPGADVIVHRVANTEGFVDELTLAATLAKLGTECPVPDVVVLAFGGYSVKLGSFGTSGAGNQWLRPLVLERALLDLVARCPGVVIVASAGNNESSDPCYPAAFSEHPVLGAHVVSVAALDRSGYRWDRSNYGRWVSASTIGVRIHGLYVEGREHPANDPDGPAENFVFPAFAKWSGTSFAAPLVAGRIVELQHALVADLGRDVPATEAWGILRSVSKRQREGNCGVHVLIDGISID